MATPETDVAVAIDAAVAGLTLGTNLFDGPIRPARDGFPDEAVFCIPTGGPSPDAFVGGGSTKQIANPTVQVRVRGDRDDFDGGLALARSVRDALHLKDGVGTSFDTRIVESEPNYLGEDEAKHPEWSMNVNLRIEE